MSYYLVRIGEGSKYVEEGRKGNFIIAAKSGNISVTAQLVVSKQKEPITVPIQPDKQKTIK